MEARPDLPPAMRRRFRTGRMCLDLTHTGGEGEAARWEIIHTPADASRFLGIIIGTEWPVVGSRNMADVRDLRSAISGWVRARVAGEREPSRALKVINAAARRPALVPQLDEQGGRLLLRGTASQALSTIARDAIDLFSSQWIDRVRICEAGDCGLLFVDTSRPGKRRWCSMEWCGDRAKKRAAGRAIPEGDIA